MAYSVLIVDDSPAMRKFIRRTLTLTGLDIGECAEANHGREALDMLATHWMDIVLTDINMPTMNGEELVEHLAADPLFCTIPVVVISTDKSDARLARMLALGVKEYVTKPFAPETLGSAMERLLTGVVAHAHAV